MPWLVRTCEKCGRTKQLRHFPRDDSADESIPYHLAVQPICRKCRGGSYMGVYRRWMNRARSKTFYAMKRGYIARPRRCGRCGFECKKLHAHHNDYSKPLDVEWLCPSCHSKHHRGKRVKRGAKTRKG